jgi:arginyl-tRNA synthetase
MLQIDNIWKEKIASAINSLLDEKTCPIAACGIIAEAPPKPEMGDIGFPMFPFAKLLRKAPPEIARLVAEKLMRSNADGTVDDIAKLGKVSPLGPYLNVALDRGTYVKKLFDEKRFEQKKTNCIISKALSGKRVMLEFSSPNTNKPLHLGHLRNDVLGESLSRILKAADADVQKVCIINDRGVHICKSMLSYKELGNGETPESTGIKSDRFVGDYYVKFNELSKTDENAEERAQEMLRQWEAGNAQITGLWKKMNDWAVSGIKETYKRTGIAFDKYYFESETYLKGKDEVQTGLKGGVFYKEADGSVWVDLENDGLGKKALLRKDGTSLYITQDIGTAIYRYNDWPFEQLIYVVGSEQIHHFKTLFCVLKKLGFSWASQLYHLAYGMVKLPEGKMKSREGTVVDADDLIDNLAKMALDEIKEKEREEEVGDAQDAAEKIALGALHYYLLQVSPAKDMLFDPKESLSFNGNTGPYLQYMGARLCSLLRKAGSEGFTKNLDTECNYKLLIDDADWELVKTISAFPSAVSEAATKLDSSCVSAYCYELAKAFGKFYHESPVLALADKNLAAARIGLCKQTLSVLREAMRLICVPFLEAM